MQVGETPQDKSKPLSDYLTTNSGTTMHKFLQYSFHFNSAELKAITSFITEDLPPGKDPIFQWPKLLDLVDSELIKTSVGITGAIGVGKSTYIEKQIFDIISNPVSKDNQSSHNLKSGITIIKTKLYINCCVYDYSIFFPDFSAYISKYLRDIPPKACFHASVMYRNFFDDLEEYFKLEDENYQCINDINLIWDRSPLENVIFGDHVNLEDAGLLGPEFWHSKAFLKVLKAFMPKKMSLFVIDEKERQRRVAQRNRCSFEINNISSSSEEKTTLFNKKALSLYGLLGIETEIVTNY